MEIAKDWEWSKDGAKKIHFRKVVGLGLLTVHWKCDCRTVSVRNDRHTVPNYMTCVCVCVVLGCSLLQYGLVTLCTLYLRCNWNNIQVSPLF
jgi:hypothetical protein